MKENTNEYFAHTKEMCPKDTNYKQIPYKLILDSELTKNDIAIYIALQHSVDVKGEATEVRHKLITNKTGISQPNQSRSIPKLESKGYISKESGDNCDKYKITNILTKEQLKKSNNFIELPLDYMVGIKKDKIGYVRKLIFLALSNGNEIFPRYNTCKKHIKNISRPEYNLIKAIGELGSLIDIYESLKILTSNEVKKQARVIALNAKLKEAQEEDLVQQLNALLEL